MHMGQGDVVHGFQGDTRAQQLADHAIARIHQHVTPSASHRTPLHQCGGVVALQCGPGRAGPEKGDGEWLRHDLANTD